MLLGLGPTAVSLALAAVRYGFLGFGGGGGGYGGGSSGGGFGGPSGGGSGPMDDEIPF